MTPTMKNLGIDRLSPDERIALALEIWESLEDQPIPAMTPVLRGELANRDAEMENHPEIALTWEQIRASVEHKL